MDFLEVVKQARAALQSEGRITYRTLKRQFALDDEALEDLKFELIEGQEVATDKDGKMLVWVGDGSKGETEQDRSGLRTSDPGQWTPPHLAERIRAEQAAMETRGAVDGERKTITALFADLKGSTALIEGLDPEDARAIIDPALQLMMDAVHRYDGYVAQALGDGIFALFGAPIAHEDHPQRALYAALRMQEEMRRYSDKLREEGAVPLQMRVGVNTGEVVMRSIRKDDLHADYVPVGHSTNMAARMEQLVNPGSILVTEQTQKLTDGYFEFTALGKTKVKGLEAPVPIYEVRGVGLLRTRLQVAARRGLTRFVGRHSELDQLQQALAQAKAGHGQIVGVMGEPGLGKSRLFYEFVGARRAVPLLAHGCLVLEAYSVSHGKATAYLPVIELLKSYFDIQPQDDERKRREKVAGKVVILDRTLEELLPYLYALLGIEEQPSPLQHMDAQIRRRRTFEALKKLFLRESLNQPLILIFEDLHWLDSETQGFLDTLSDSVASAKLLLLVNYRPEYRHEWGQKTYYAQLRLVPFGKEEAEEFLDALLGSYSSPQPSPQRGEGESPLPNGERDRVRGMEENFHALKQLILDKTEGTPFFMEEVVQTLFEEGVLSGERGSYRFTQHASMQHVLTWHIPPTVQGVLAARIDRLTVEEKELLQQLAVIGRQFPVSLVKQVVQQPEDQLHRVLSSLQAKEFLYEQPAFPESEYLFKHALMQEVAYGTVLQEQRKALHERTGQAMERLYKENLEDHYSELAYQYSRSGNPEKAVQFLWLTGQQAAQRSAHAEAIRHLTAALELLQTLPDTPERTQQELMLLITLGAPLTAARGYATPEVERTYARARELYRQVGETPQLFRVLFGSWGFYVARAELQTARALAEQQLRLAQRVQDPALLLEAYSTLGISLVWLGEFVPGLATLERGLALYDPQKAHPNVLQDSGVVCLVYSAWALWYLGYPDQAIERINEAIAWSQNLSHPYSLAASLLVASQIHQLRREVHVVQERAEAVVTLSTEQGFPLWLSSGTYMRGWALTEQGRGEEGIKQIREGIAAFQATATKVARPYMLGLLAQAHGSMGQVEEGLTVVAEALTAVQSGEQGMWEAEVYWLKGELTLQQQFKAQGSKFKDPNTQHLTPNPQAEACFLKAIEIAQKQQAKSWELRAATSLARLWQQQGKQAEARDLLAPVYNWFTEGFDTADLQDAKALLDAVT